MAHTTYTITITNWDKHNPKRKKGYTHFMFHSGFFQDPKIAQLSTTEMLLFINFLCTANEVRSNSFVTHTKLLPRSIVMYNKALRNALVRLQSFQLLSFTENEPLIITNNIKNNGRSNRRKNDSEESARPKKHAVEILSAEGAPPIASGATGSKIGQQLVAHYCNLWKSKYGGQAAFHPKDLKNLKTVGETNGLDRTRRLLDAYFQMHERTMVQRRHDLQTFIFNLAAVSQFAESGRMLTQRDLRTIETASNLENSIRSIREEGI